MNYIRQPYYLGDGALRKEVKSILRTEFYPDSFTNPELSFDDFPLLKHYIDNKLRYHANGHFVRFMEGDCAMDIPPCMFELQQHLGSVLSHTDDVLNYFCIVPLKIKYKVSHYDTGCVFRYTNSVGFRCEDSVAEGSVIVFDPKEPHEYIFCGDVVTIALFTVQKK